MTSQEVVDFVADRLAKDMPLQKICEEVFFGSFCFLCKIDSLLADVQQLFIAVDRRRRHRLRQHDGDHHQVDKVRRNAVCRTSKRLVYCSFRLTIFPQSPMLRDVMRAMMLISFRSLRSPFTPRLALRVFVASFTCTTVIRPSRRVAPSHLSLFLFSSLSSFCARLIMFLVASVRVVRFR